MRDFFSLEGPFNKYGSMVADMIILSLMWLLFSILGLGLTIGVSTSALFYVTTRRIANREGYITTDFWLAFKANFKKVTKIWLIMFAAILLLIFNILNIEAVGNMSVVILPAQIIIFLQIVLISIYIFPMAARFDMGAKELIKSSFFMANRHLLTSITCLVLLLAAIFSFMLIPHLALFLAPGLYALLSSYMIMRIFKRYRPEMDKDPMLEIQELEAQKVEERRLRSIGTMSDDDEETEEQAEIIEEPVILEDSNFFAIVEQKKSEKKIEKAADDFWADIEDED